MYNIDHLSGMVIGYHIWVRKVEYAMSGSSVVCISHRIAILMSSEGRFLECRNCLRRVRFLAGAHYEVIAKQFESHSCSASISSRVNSEG
jgi:hypothetical protein